VVGGWWLVAGGDENFILIINKLSMSEFTIEITSYPHKEKLVAEVWFSETLIAVINQEKKNPEIELFLSKKNLIPLKGFQEALEHATNSLME
jgi:hypothetical protein